MKRDAMMGLMGIERDVRSNCVRNIGSLLMMGVVTNRASSVSLTLCWCGAGRATEGLLDLTQLCVVRFHL